MMKQDLGELVLEQVRRTRRENKAFDMLLDIVASGGDAVLVGGAPRDWFLGRAPRDLDIVVEAPAATLDRALSSWTSSRTRYGGHRLSFDGLSIDIWSVQSTWAFTVHKTIRVTLANLPQTAFYNVDALAVSAVSGEVFEHGFMHAVRSRELSTVFEENPFPALCAVRGLVLSKQYGLRPGQAVLRYIDRLVEAGTRWSDLDRAQMSHYGERRVVPSDLSKLFPTSTCSAMLRNSA